MLGKLKFSLFLCFGSEFQCAQHFTYLRNYLNWYLQRYRRAEESGSSGSGDDSYVPYVPVKERKKQQFVKLGRLTQVRSEPQLIILNLVYPTVRSIQINFEENKFFRFLPD